MSCYRFNHSKHKLDIYLSIILPLIKELLLFEDLLLFSSHTHNNSKYNLQYRPVLQKDQHLILQSFLQLPRRHYWRCCWRCSRWLCLPSCHRPYFLVLLLQKKGSLIGKRERRTTCLEPLTARVYTSTTNDDATSASNDGSAYDDAASAYDDATSAYDDATRNDDVARNDASSSTASTYCY